MPYKFNENIYHKMYEIMFHNNQENKMSEVKDPMPFSGILFHSPQGIVQQKHSLYHVLTHILRQSIEGNQEGTSTI